MVSSVPTGGVTAADVIDTAAHTSIFYITQHYGSVLLIKAMYGSFAPIVSIAQLVFALICSSVVLGDSSARLIEARPWYNGDDGAPTNSVVLLQSTITLHRVQAYQQWGNYDPEFSVVNPFMMMQHVSHTTVSLVSCELRCNQKGASRMTPLLLQASGNVLQSAVVLVNTTVAYHDVLPRAPPLIQLHSIQSSRLQFQGSVFTNLSSLLVIVNSSSPLNSDVIVVIGCANTWCAPGVRRCAVLTSFHILNRTVQPQWLAVSAADGSCSRSSRRLGPQAPRRRHCS
jgi:hypothetical protein